MFCKNCGNELKDEVKFCSKCGTPVGTTEIPKNEEAVQMASSPIVSDKNVIIGKSYIFNNVKVSRSLLGFFSTEK